MSKGTKLLKFLVSILVCQGAGIISSVFTSPAIPAWYASLQKPSFSPPNWLFAPAWATLYLLMGIAAFLVWSSYTKAADRQERKKIKVALNIFGIQLFLNAIWSIIFFGLKSPGWALVEIIFLWLAILLTIIAFYKISKPAAYLLVPYILWVSFASVLNYFIWHLN